MPSNQHYIQKTVTSEQLMNQGGILSDAQSKAFIRKIFDATELFPKVRRVEMRSWEEQINKISIGSRLMRVVEANGENEDQSPYAKNASFDNVVLTAKKMSLPWEVSEDALEDNIEGKSLETTLAEMFAKQIGLDLEDAFLNGAIYAPPATALTAGINAVVTTIPVTSTTGYPSDSDSGYLILGDNTFVGAYELVSYGAIDATNFLNAIRGSGPAGQETVAQSWLIATAVNWLPHPLIGRIDGWIRLAETNGGNLVDLSGITSGDLSKESFFEMEKALPTQYLRGAAKNELRWVCSYRQYINWQEYLANQNANRGYDVLAGTEFWPLGIAALPVTKMTHSKILLTWPKNLVAGIWRQLKIRKASEDKSAIMTDKRFYNATVRGIPEIEWTDGVVVGYGLTGDAALAP